MDKTNQNRYKIERWKKETSNLVEEILTISLEMKKELEKIDFEKIKKQVLNKYPLQDEYSTLRESAMACYIYQVSKCEFGLGDKAKIKSNLTKEEKKFCEEVYAKNEYRIIGNNVALFKKKFSESAWEEIEKNTKKYNELDMMEKLYEKVLSTIEKIANLSKEVENTENLIRILELSRYIEKCVESLKNFDEKFDKIPSYQFQKVAIDELIAQYMTMCLLEG